MSEELENNTNLSAKYRFYDAKRIYGNGIYDWYIPYLDDKEIVVPCIGRGPTNMLDSLTINAERAGIPISDGLGLASIESKFGSVPNRSTKEWISKFERENNRKPTKEEIKNYERKVINMSYARNFGGIYPDILINDHDWSNNGWEQSPKYNKILGNIESPLQHGFTLYKYGLYNTGDKNHTIKIKNEGDRLFQTELIQKWYNDYLLDRESGKIKK